MHTDEVSNPLVIGVYLRFLVLSFFPKGGRNSAVECQVANLVVVGSNPIARSYYSAWLPRSLAV